METTALKFEQGFDFSFLFGKKKIFIIHGHDEDNLQKLEYMLYRLNLEPVVLKNIQTFTAHALIEKFEKIGGKCNYAIALCTPDDKINRSEKTYYQVRPNVIYELGWFCAKIGRKKVMMITKENTEIFSDFSGVVQLKFKDKIDESSCSWQLMLALKHANLI